MRERVASTERCSYRRFDGMRFLALVALCLAFGLESRGSEQLLNSSFQNKQWSAAAQAAFDVLKANPRHSEARLKGAYALFQQGFPNSALILLRHLTPEQWASVPQGEDRFVEVVTLLQKKVPLNLLSGRVTQLNENQSSASLQNEIIFAKGRDAYERGDLAAATRYLNTVSPTSRYFTQSHYLLAAIAIKNQDYPIASAEVARMFEPTLLQQSSEFWKDVATDITPQWGASLRIFFDVSELNSAKALAELGILANARILYAKKEFELALAQYARIPPTSELFARSQLERLWTLLQLNRHEDAQRDAAKLMVDAKSFQAVEARTVRAVILADQGKTEEARAEIAAFLDVFKRLNDGLEKYKAYGIKNSLPEFIVNDVKNDKRLQSLSRYENALVQEVQALNTYQNRIYPVYQYLANQLQNLVREAKEMEGKITRDVVILRMGDLDRLYVQSRLIRAETFLEDREKMRNKFSGSTVTEAEKTDYDGKLVDLLTQAVAEVDAVLDRMPKRNPFLEFRQSELLWELGTARLILAQSVDKAKNSAMGEKLRARSLDLAEKVVNDFPKFSKRDQAMFFMGFAQFDQEKEEKAIATLKTYVQVYPAHEHAADAHRMLGDYYFDKNQFQLATFHYSKVLDFQDSAVIGYALYKIAWCAYNEREYAKALLALEKAVTWANKAQEAQGLLSLKRESRRDLIQIYSEVGDARKALDYFERFIGEDSYNWLEDLAKTYDEMGQYEKSVYLYNVLISLNTSPEKNIFHQTAVVRANLALLQWDEVIRTAGALTDDYKPRLIKPMPEGDAAFDAEKVVRDASLAQHFELRGTEDPVLIERVLKLDKIYFSAFGQWPTAQEPMYKHAFFLYGKSRYGEAVEAFRDHWERFKTVLKDPTREEALRNLINSLDNVEAGKEGKKNGPDKEDKKDEKKEEQAQNNKQAIDAPPAGPITPAATDIIKYAEEYHRNYPKNEHARTIAFLRSAMLLKYDKLEQGIAETQALWEENFKDKLAKPAFNNLRIAYYRQKNWKSAYEWATKMLASPDLGLREYEKDLSTVREEALFLWADQTKDNSEAGELFLKAARDPRMSRLKEKSLYNAIVRFNQADDRVKVLALSDEIEKLAPKSESVERLNGIRAALYQEAGNYVVALPLFENFLRKPPPEAEPAVVFQALLNTALIYQAAGKMKEAHSLYKEYLAKAGKGAPGIGQAEASIKYIESKAPRAPAAVFKPWEILQKTRANFEKAPLPTTGTLGAKVKGGLQNLDAATQQFFDVAASDAAPANYSFEAYCSVPFLYRAYTKSVMALVDSLPETAREDVRKELSKVTAPMDTKADDFAMECLKKSMASAHDGPVFRQVNREWGWEKDAALKEKVETAYTFLEDTGPWIEPSPMNKKEEEILSDHLKKLGNHDTWYALARLRFDTQRLGLARLTLIDALSRVKAGGGKSAGQATANAPAVSSDEGRILNGLAFIEWKSSPDSVAPLFEKAGDAGSHLAYVNLAIIYLKSGRLDQGVAALQKANLAGVFRRMPTVQEAVNEIMPKPEEPRK